jgi:hypothetical protein
VQYIDELYFSFILSSLSLDSDVKDILEIAHRKTVESSTALQLLFQNLKTHFPGELSISDFCNWTKLNPSVLTPLLLLQLKLRRSLISEGFWMKLADDRQRHPEMGKLTFIKDLQDKIKAKLAGYRSTRALRGKEQDIEKRKGIVDGKDTRNVVVRKQSLLLQSFNLVQGNQQDKRRKESERRDTKKQKNDVEVVELVGDVKKKPLMEGTKQSRKTLVDTASSSVSEENNTGMKREASVKGRSKTIVEPERSSEKREKKSRNTLVAS